MSVVIPTITSAGKEMNPGFPLLSIDIEREVNRIPRAELRLAEGDAAERGFAISDAAFFEPGKEIEIKLRYEGEPDTSVFKGVVVRQTVEATADGCELAVTMKDAAVALTGARKSAVFRDKSDSDVIAEIVLGARLQKGTIADTKVKHPEIVQYYCTDWDFILSRADVSGLVVVADDGTVSVAEMAVTKRPNYTFKWGISEIYNFEMEADAGYQFAAVESVALSREENKLTTASKARAVRTSQGNLDGSKLAEALGFTSYTLSHLVPEVAPGELAAWADAWMARNRMAMLRGRIAAPGFADVKPLDTMEVAGVGAHWNGTTLVTGLRHRVDHTGWQTDVAFGLSPEWFAKSAGIAAVPAAGLLPPARGLQVGVVKACEGDKEFRIQVVLPAVDAQKAIWARLASLDAGTNHGIVFRPEPGDEVVVGFLNDDPRHPVILGAFHSSKNVPPKLFNNPTDENFEKGIVTKKGTTLSIIEKDDKSTVLIKTKTGNGIRFDDQEERVEIFDQHHNKVTMSKNGITIETKGQFTVTAEKGAKINSTEFEK